MCDAVDAGRSNARMHERIAKEIERLKKEKLKPTPTMTPIVTKKSAWCAMCEEG